MKRSALRSVSPQRCEELREYAKIKKEFLAVNYCEPCKTQDHIYAEAQEVHHMAGRNGRRLTMTQCWLPVCRMHHRMIHDNPKWARERGYLKPFVQLDR